MNQELIVRRRLIAPGDLELIRQLIVTEGALGRSHLSNRLCAIWDWRQANGHYRQIACRDLLRRLEAKGRIELPPPLRAARRPGYRNHTRLPELWDTLASRDRYIGWSAQARQQRLDWVVNNDRFLILPGVRIAHLASHVLAATLRRLRADWQRVYGHDLALAETFIEADRFRGTCYAAANWACIGQTRGRGRNDRAWARTEPIKTVWVYPLRADFRAVLSQGVSP